MLACRLCLALGIDDPEVWLETASERQLALWQAFYRLEPWGAEFHRSATQATLTSALTSMIAASHGQEVEIQPMERFMPSDWDEATKKKKKRGKGMSAKQAEKAFAKMFPSPAQRRVK